MRLAWIALGCLLALTAVAVGGLAHAPGADDPVVIEVDEADEGTPAPACIPFCEVDSTRQAYRPSALVVQDGAEVTWASADGDGHTSTANPPTDTPGIIAEGSSNAYPDACFDVHYQPGSPGSVAFEIREDGLYALETSTFGATWQPCEEAVETEAGWLLTYHCKIHSQFQHGSLLVLAS